MCGIFHRPDHILKIAVFGKIKGIWIDKQRRISSFISRIITISGTRLNMQELHLFKNSVVPFYRHRILCPFICYSVRRNSPCLILFRSRNRLCCIRSFFYRRLFYHCILFDILLHFFCVFLNRCFFLVVNDRLFSSIFQFLFGCRNLIRPCCNRRSSGYHAKCQHAAQQLCYCTLFHKQLPLTQ